MNSAAGNRTPVNTPTGPQDVTSDVDPEGTPVSPGELAGYVQGADVWSNVARAQARLFGEGLRFYLIVVSPNSSGLEGEIYRDLVKRNFRATTGPDEGFDTSSLKYHPNCVFIHSEAVNELSVESWTNVLRHEQRHMVQAGNNPELARAFRPNENGTFTTYAAFLEGCADDGIFVGEETYHASDRMPKLEEVVGVENAEILKEACKGDPSAFDNLVEKYDAAIGTGAFEKLFPPFK